MFSRRALAGLLLGIFALASIAPSQDTPKEDPAANDQQEVASKVAHKATAASVNFRKELKLPFASLNTLGSRIDAARRAPDPVALAHAASELSVAENVSGRKASLTASKVMQESAELAKLRKQATELQAVEKVAEQVATEQDLVTQLKKQIADAQAEAQLQQQAFERNQEPTWQPRKVVVNNYTPQLLTIYVNGIYKGEIQPGMGQTYIIEHRWNPTVLTAYGDQDIDSWGPRYIWGRFQTYKWNIN